MPGIKAYYNEIDPYAASWLRNLIAERLIADGDVDERSIVDVSATDLRGYAQCHFFAGIGGWSLALRLAGWPDDRPIWTGSCPCQPFSCAGKGLGTDDERHLWPEFYRLIRECRPATVFGEQVASKPGRGWLSGVFADLENVGYAVAGADLCAAGTGKKTSDYGLQLLQIIEDELGADAGSEFWEWWLASGNYAMYDTDPGAPHIRQRLYWLADAKNGGFGIDGSAPGHAGYLDEHEPALRMGQSDRAGSQQGRPSSSSTGYGSTAIATGDACGVGYTENIRRDVIGNEQHAAERGEVETGVGSITDRLADTEHKPGSEEQFHHAGEWKPEGPNNTAKLHGYNLGPYWNTFDLIPCADTDEDGRYKIRRISAQPGDEPLAYGLPRSVGPGGARGERVELVAAKANRVGRLRGYGNAIVPEVAAEFVSVMIEVINE
jgi:DNA (cytosine-5)-methyltransferase 1